MSVTGRSSIQFGAKDQIFRHIIALEFTYLLQFLVLT